MGRAFSITLACAALCFASGTARAGDTEQADALVEEGNQLGAAGDYEGAINKFRAADAIVQRPIHACNIGLAYVRLSLWAEAHYYLERCKGTWAEGPLPSWVDRRIGESEGALTKGNFARVEVEVSPASATVIVAPFPGQPLWAKRLWLPFGTHTITASGDGLEDAAEQLILASRETRTVKLALKERVATESTPLPGTEPDGEQGRIVKILSTHENAPPPRRDRSKAWLYAGIGASVATVATAGLGFYFRAKANDSSDSAGELVTYDDDDNFFERLVTYQEIKDDVRTYNTMMVSSWTLAAVGAGLGTWFFLEAFGGDDDGPAVSASVNAEGGDVSMHWNF